MVFQKKKRISFAHYKFSTTDHRIAIFARKIKQSPEQFLGYDGRRISKRCGRDDICYSSIFRTDTLSIVPINSVKSACCSLYFCHDFALKISQVLMFWIVQLPAVKKSCILKYAILKLSVFVCSTNFWMFDENRVPLLHTFEKLWHFKV